MGARSGGDQSAEQIATFFSGSGLRHADGQRCAGRDRCTRDKAKVEELLDSVPEPVLTPRIVSDGVNSVTSNGPELVEPADA